MIGETLAVSAPANLLLMGEYAVLEEGGLGLAIAPDIRVTGTLTATASGNRRGPHPSDPGAAAGTAAGTAQCGISITGRLPGTTVKWPDTSGGKSSGLLGLAADHLCARFCPAGLTALIDLESGALFTAEGRKRGFGSSAAIVVALTALWLRATGNLPDQPDDARKLVFQVAVDAHRAGQNGRGSGYDIACSTFGGVTLFTGGARPTAVGCALPWLPAIHLFEGPSAVSTVDAVGAYRRWKERSPAAAREYLRDSNQLVTAFANASDWESGAGILAEYRDLATQLGGAIGVPAGIRPPAWCSDSASIVKAVGAGNELGIVLGGLPGAFHDEPPDDRRASRRGGASRDHVGEVAAEQMVIADEGFRWS